MIVDLRGFNGFAPTSKSWKYDYSLVRYPAVQLAEIQSIDCFTTQLGYVAHWP